MIEWKAVREATSRFLPQHAAAAAWKHRNMSHVEQDGLAPMPKDRGAEQGDVNGPLECSPALGMVAAETRRRVAAQQASGSLPWIIVDDPSELQRLQAEHTAKLQRVSNFQLGGPEQLTGDDGPRHALQEHGGLADLWHMDGGDVVCHPILLPSYLHEFDHAFTKVGAERKPTENGGLLLRGRQGCSTS